MEPQIQFCTSTDGTRIAYSVMGQGSPLVCVPSWASNLELNLKHPEARNFFLRLSREHSLINFDFRGIGLSQRKIPDLSLDTCIADINAVADKLELEQFDLWGIIMGAAISIAYAARYPDRVSKLVLWGAYTHGEEIIKKDAMQGLVGLVRSNWSLARRSVADLCFPTGPTAPRDWFSDLIRQSMSPEILAKYLELQLFLDLRSHLPQVKAPTFLLHRRDDHSVPIAAGRAVAAMIPDARFITLDGDISHVCFGDISYMEQALQFLEGRSGTDAALSDEPPPVEDAKIDPMVGRIISHYKISEKLGEGGMGVVYKAEDTKLRRTIALKFFTPQMLGAEEDKTRFIREAQAAASLDHPNICTVFEIDDFKGQTFIAMAHIEGQGLDERLKSGPLDVNEAIKLAIQVAEGLQEAHDKGVIHRDIKASNIMVTKRGHARIMDFGLAKLSGQSRLTKTATIMGTVAYMSPEQAHGKVAIDHRTDIWSLGVVLYEMLTGAQPFIAPTDAGLIYKIIHEEPEPIITIRSDIPESLTQAVKKMMQKEPDDRYEDMGALVSDLKAIRAGAAPDIAVKEKHIPSIAVLPFADMSPQKDQEYFCEGISESLINALTQLSDLKVIARTSAFSFKGQNLDVREIGKKLSVGTVLEGSIQTAGKRVRITAQLINTDRGQHLWSEKYDRDMNDIFAIQDEITEAIILKLKPWLVGEEKARLAKQRQTVDVDVYNLYLRGRHFWNRRSEEGINRAIECFTEAIDKAPTYAPPYTGLADCHILSAWYEFLSPREAFPKARIVALKAMEINDLLAEAHTSLAQINSFFDWNWEDAEKRLKRAIALNSGYASAHEWYAVYLSIVGRSDEAIAEIEQALELDPFSLGINLINGVILLNTRHYDLAIQALKKTIELDPSYAYAHNFLGAAYFGKGIYEEALTAYEKAEKLPQGRVRAKAGIATVRASTGRMDEARSILTELLELRKKRYVRPIYLAYVYLALGEPDQCFKWLNKAYEERDEFLSLINSDPILDALDIRSDPRYIELLKKMNLANDRQDYFPLQNPRKARRGRQEHSL